MIPTVPTGPVKKRTRGRAVVVGVGILLGLNLCLALFVVDRARRAEKPLLDCSRNRWEWTGVLERLEWNLRRFEMYAPKCLDAGIPLVSRLEGARGYEVLQLQSARPVIRESGSADVTVTADHFFDSGALVWVCGDQGAFRAEIGESIREEPAATTFRLKFDSPNPPQMLSIGTIVAHVQPAQYRLQESEGRSSRLELKNVMKSNVQGVKGVGSINFLAEPLRDRSQFDLHLVLAGEECRIERRFRLLGSYPQAGWGYWTLHNQKLNYSKWFVPKDERRVP